jgi:hypothetical protein
MAIYRDELGIKLGRGAKQILGHYFFIERGQTVQNITKQYKNSANLIKKLKTHGAMAPASSPRDQAGGVANKSHHHSTCKKQGALRILVFTRWLEPLNGTRGVSSD